MAHPDIGRAISLFNEDLGIHDNEIPAKDGISPRGGVLPLVPVEL